MSEFLGLISGLFFWVMLFALWKPHLFKTTKRPAGHFSRLEIFAFSFFGFVVSLILGISLAKPINPNNAASPPVPVDASATPKPDESTSDEPVKELTPAEEFAQNRADYDERDKPHFDFPPVDYNQAIAKVDLTSDRAILNALGKPVVEKEKGSNSNGEPMVTYWFDKRPIYGVSIELSREFIDVAWQFHAEDKAASTQSFNDGQRITRALLGGKSGSDLYENIAKGLKYDELSLDDGTVIQNARCGSFICRYRILR